MAPVKAAGAAVAAISISILSVFLCKSISNLSTRKSQKLLSKSKDRKGLIAAIGNTSLVRINSLSDATGCEILAKAEFLNPGGSVKDRVAVKIIEEGIQADQMVSKFVLRNHFRMTAINGGVGALAPVGFLDHYAQKLSFDLWSIAFYVSAEVFPCHLAIKATFLRTALDSGNLVRGGVVTEGSAGSTAISLATVAPAYGCKCHVVIPDDAAIEKSQILEALGATVERVRPVSITHRDHYVNIARRRAAEFTELALRQRETESSLHVNGHVSDEDHPCTSAKDYKGGFFADQFENLANFRAHYEDTGPEIWEQTAGKLDAFIAAAGTGGTLAGVSRFLQEKNPNIKCFLIDPPGSGLFNKVTRGVMYTREEAEGQRLKNPFDTITEGIGINRLTKNFMMAKLDGAFRGTDMEAVEMSRFLLRNDGLFIGSSSAMNCVGAVRAAQALGPGHIIVTILCDSGMRHLSKFHNPQYLSDHDLTPTASGLEFLGIT